MKSMFIFRSIICFTPCEHQGALALLFHSTINIWQCRRTEPVWALGPLFHCTINIQQISLIVSLISCISKDIC